MPRKALIRSTTLPYHVTARANNREPFPFKLDLFWTVLCNQCFDIGLIHDARIHALVLMPNHFHMLISTCGNDLGTTIRVFMRSITQVTHAKTGRSGRIFGGTYHWSLIDSPVYFAHAYKYVYRNPVRAGLCRNVEQHPFSTIEHLSSDRPVPFPLWYPFNAAQYQPSPIVAYGFPVLRSSSLGKREARLTLSKRMRDHAWNSKSAENIFSQGIQGRPLHWTPLVSVFLAKISEHLSTHTFDFSVKHPIGIAVTEISAPSSPDRVRAFACLLMAQCGLEFFLKPYPQCLSRFFRGLSGNPKVLWIVLK